MNGLWSIGIGSLMATMACGSRAEIVATNLPVPLFMRSEFFAIPYPIDLNADSIIDFTFNADYTSVGLFANASNRLVYRVEPPPNLGGPVASLPGGLLIASNLTDSSVAWGSSVGYGYYGLISVLISGSSTDFNGRGYIGLEFGLPDGTHYGYFDLDAGPGFPAATLYGWAYETTPGVPIVAGAVPEPSSLWLLVAAGLAGACIRIWRLRRGSEAS